MRKVVFVPDLSCLYRWNEEIKELEVCYMFQDGTFDLNEWNAVEPDLVGEEEVTYKGKKTTLYKVYEDVRRRLRVNKEVIVWVEYKFPDEEEASFFIDQMVEDGRKTRIENAS